jgi:hypothetical protein
VEVGIRRQKGGTLLDKQNHFFLAVYIVDLVLHVLYSVLLDDDLNLMPEKNNLNEISENRCMVQEMWAK